MSENDVRQRFKDYSEAFSARNVSKIVSYYHYPAVLIDRDKEPVTFGKFIGPLKAFIGFTKVLGELKKRGFAFSKLDGEPHVQMLNANLATVRGNATRYITNGEELERFGYTYTFRKVSQEWKIVVGIIHDLDK
jgi:ketosteroid isomerase-like protein